MKIHGGSNWYLIVISMSNVSLGAIGCEACGIEEPHGHGCIW